ncbi:copper resistance protein CopC [Rhodococcus sp. NPDC003318]|uniref:copper resistance CopC family protein n=1 Tax=Rhodococcus sp. NPDC003318 TaxID=3364503 RepID=UPI0036B90CA2
MRILAVTLLTALAALCGVGVAGAHSAVTGFSPENGESVATGPERVTVTFNEPLQTSFASLTVVGPDGNLWSKGDPTVQGPTVSVPVGELGPVGEYTIAYRVTSADGHPVSGTSTFTLTTEGTGTPGAPADGGSASEGEDEGSGVPLWPFVVAAVVVFGGGLAFALRKPKQ